MLSSGGRGREKSILVKLTPGLLPRLLRHGGFPFASKRIQNNFHAHSNGRYLSRRIRARDLSNAIPRCLPWENANFWTARSCASRSDVSLRRASRFLFLFFTLRSSLLLDGKLFSNDSSAAGRGSTAAAKGRCPASAVFPNEGERNRALNRLIGTFVKLATSSALKIHMLRTGEQSERLGNTFLRVYAVKYLHRCLVRTFSFISRTRRCLIIRIIEYISPTGLF